MVLCNAPYAKIFMLKMLTECLIALGRYQTAATSSLSLEYLPVAALVFMTNNCSVGPTSIYNIMDSLRTIFCGVIVVLQLCKIFPWQFLV